MPHSKFAPESFTNNSSLTPKASLDNLVKHAINNTRNHNNKMLATHRAGMYQRWFLFAGPLCVVVYGTVVGCWQSLSTRPYFHNYLNMFGSTKGFYRPELFIKDQEAAVFERNLEIEKKISEGKASEDVVSLI